METLKNFVVGLFVALAAFILLGLFFFLWPLLVGIGSILLFIAVIVLAIILGFCIIILIGYVVRKGLKK